MQNREFCKNLEMRANLASISIIDLVNSKENKRVLTYVGDTRYFDDDNFDGIIGDTIGDKVYITYESSEMALLYPQYSYLVDYLTGLFSNSDLETLDVYLLDTSNVIDMSGVFHDCPKLISIKGLEYWDTSKAKRMSEMLAYCQNLKYANLTNLYLKNCEDVSDFFYESYEFESIEGVTDERLIDEYNAMKEAAEEEKAAEAAEAAEAAKKKETAKDKGFAVDDLDENDPLWKFAHL